MKIKHFISIFFVLFCLTGCVNKTHQTTIKFASWGSKSEIGILRPVLAEFEKENPDIKVEFIHIPQNYFQKIHLLFASNLAPDVIFVNNLYLPIYANAGVLEEFQKQNEVENTRRQTGKQMDEPALVPSCPPAIFFDKALEALSYHHKLYAIPRDVSNLVIYYNKDIFKKYHVRIPNKYWTFDDFLTTAQNLTRDTNGDGKTDVWGISFDEDPFFFLPYLTSQGGGFLSDDLNKIIINSPQSKKGLNFYADLRKKYHVAPTQSESASETMAQMFLQEKLAMQVSGRWLVPKYRTDAKFNWNVINFPAGDKGSVVPLDASGWAISKSSKHKQEAMKLIDYLSSKKVIEKFSQSGLIVPARIDVANGVFLQDNLPPTNSKVFINVIETSKPTPVSTNYNEVLDSIKEKTNYLFN